MDGVEGINMLSDEKIKTIKDIIKMEPTFFNFIYEGYECEIARYEHNIHLCGYVYLTK